MLKRLQIVFFISYLCNGIRKQSINLKLKRYEKRKFKKFGRSSFICLRMAYFTDGGYVYFIYKIISFYHIIIVLIFKTLQL